MELDTKQYANEAYTGSVIDKYGTRLASAPEDSVTARPTQLVGKVKGPQTQKATTERRLSVKQSEVVKRLSDPNWLTSKGVNLNQTTPQEQVNLYLQSEGIKLTPKTRLVFTNENVDFRGEKYSPPLSQLKTEPEKPITTKSANLAPSPNYPGAQNQVTYVPANPKSLSVTPSELERAGQMHLLNYISAAHGQIKGGARVGGTKMRNKLTPYQEPSDAMLKQLVMKRRMER